MLKKLSGDVVHRIFQILPEFEEDLVDKTLDKKLLMKCFLTGKSEPKWGKVVKSQRVNVGREIKSQFQGVEKKFLTADLFEKPTCLQKKNEILWFSKESHYATEKYLYRHAFEFEKSYCSHPVGNDYSELQIFNRVDKFDELMKVKDEIISNLAKKFRSSNDAKITGAMTELLEDHFRNTAAKITSLQEKFEIFLENQNKVQKEILENQNQSKVELLEAINEIKKKLENPNNEDQVNDLQEKLARLQLELETLQKELDNTKRLLEEEKLARKLSKVRRIPYHQGFKMLIDSNHIELNVGLIHPGRYPVFSFFI